VSRPVPKPVWWKNTFFWFAAILALLGLAGLIFGQKIIRDPGQVKENGLSWIYLAGALVMYANGWMSHRQAIQIYTEHEEEPTESKQQPRQSEQT
jgi:hypothetical protein